MDDAGLTEASGYIRFIDLARLVALAKSYRVKVRVVRRVGVLQIVDVALKAISPAVNDPTTGVTCVDQLKSRILIRLASREPPPAVLYDPPGAVRVSIPWIGFDGLLHSAFEQIRLYSKADIAVSLRMLRALSDIASTISDPDFHRVLCEKGRKIVEGCTESLGRRNWRLCELG